MMRVTLGNRKRLYVYSIRIGETPVKRVMYGGRQIWPSNDDRAASLAVDMSFFPGTEDEAYWLHALNAVENFSSRNRYMKLTAGGRSYLVNSVYGTWNRAEYGMGAFRFGDEGPLFQDVRAGDMVTVEAVVPDRYDAQFAVTADSGSSGSGEWSLPWLPGTRLWAQLDKWQKRVSSHADFTLKGFPSGTVHVAGAVHKNGHNRDTVTCEAPAQAGVRLADGSVSTASNALVNGDGFLACSVSNVNTTFRFRLHYPAFRRTWRFKVTAVYRRG